MYEQSIHVCFVSGWCIIHSSILVYDSFHSVLLNGYLSLSDMIISSHPRLQQVSPPGTKVENSPKAPWEAKRHQRIALRL